ncbi:thioesterase [Mycobacterium sp. ITM-2017-0098]|nr:thioesterase [Mycobacterium sp. ITM-2017-0098]
MTPDPAAELAASVRALIDATIRTLADSGTLTTVKSTIDSATEQLAAKLMPGSFGVQAGAGTSIVSGNVVIGERNAIAPPLTISHEQDGSVWTEFELGAGYEGPPGYVHGGVCALILDHVLGAAVHQPGHPAVTGTLTVQYRRGTPLSHPLRADARIVRTEGVKSFVSGAISSGGSITVEADGIFFFPR